MSDEEQVVTETQVLTAEFKDGQLEIVESNPVETHILPDMSEGSEEPKYQILDSSKGLLQLDLLNLTLVKCGDGEESYRLVTNQEAAEGELGETVTCVLQSSDGEDDQSGYKKQMYLTDEDQDQYVMVNGEDGPMVILKSSLEGVEVEQPKKVVKKMTAVELLEKAKAVQKAKQMMQPAKRGRKRRGTLPPPHELLSSPNFKLFLYSCKLCSFKCNAIKELTAHKIECLSRQCIKLSRTSCAAKCYGAPSPTCVSCVTTLKPQINKTAEHSDGAGRARGGARAATTTLQCARCPFRGGTHSQTAEHSDGAGRARGGARAATTTLQCARCPFRGGTHSQLMKHVQDQHLKDANVPAEVYLNSAEAEAADVLVCGACGFESASRPEFRKHIEEKHNVSTS